MNKLTFSIVIFVIFLLMIAFGTANADVKYRTSLAEIMLNPDMYNGNEVEIFANVVSVVTGYPKEIVFYLKDKEKGPNLLCKSTIGGMYLAVLLQYAITEKLQIRVRGDYYKKQHILDISEVWVEGYHFAVTGEGLSGKDIVGTPLVDKKSEKGGK